MKKDHCEGAQHPIDRRGPVCPTVVQSVGDAHLLRVWASWFPSWFGIRIDGIDQG